MSLLPLPSDVVHKIRSGITITSFSQCLTELVLNAIDASATDISVRLDLSSRRILVRDNGNGIAFDQLKVIGERYFTSKCHSLKDLNNLKYFGFRGEALASLRDVSGIIEIISKCLNCPDTFSKLFVKGKSEDYQKKSHFFLSHNATPFLLPSLKRNADHSKLQISASKIGEGEEISDNILDMLHKWKNPVFHKEDHNEVCDISIKKISKTAIKVYNLTQPHSLSKTDLNHAKVIGQVDCKFIACLIPKIEKFKARDLIVLFDQHAVHERICLEKLIEDLYENGSAKQNIKSTSIDTPITVHLRPEEIRMLKAYKNQLDKFGLKVTIDKNITNIHCIPTCLFEKISNENKKKLIESNTFIQNLLQESIQMLQQTGGGMFSLPKTLLAVLNSQACRSAIKFGDPLSKDECCKLLGLLALCKLPFQCAHGRPDLVPIADLDQLKKSESSMEKLQLLKLNR